MTVYVLQPREYYDPYLTSFEEWVNIKHGTVLHAAYAWNYPQQHQQQDGHNCGLFTIMSMMVAASGIAYPSRQCWDRCIGAMRISLGNYIVLAAKTGK